MKLSIVRDYIKKWPNTPNLTLAKLVYKENTKVFRDIEECRSLIRHSVKSNKPRCPFDELPEGMKSFAEWSPVTINADKILLISDVHIPYHDKAALEIALDYARKEKVNGVIFNGDMTDFYSMSFFDKDPRNRDFANEILTARKILSIIRGEFKNAEILYKIGNHEERFERYLKVKAPEFHGLFANDAVGLISYDAIFDTAKNKVKIVKDKRLIEVGRLKIIHGHELFQTLTNPVNPARGLFLKGKDTALCSHHHQTSDHTEGSLSGRTMSCWSVGCLCDLHPEYCTINKWNHGFAIIDNNKSDFRVYNKKIINHKVY